MGVIKWLKDCYFIWLFVCCALAVKGQTIHQVLKQKVVLPVGEVSRGVLITTLKQQAGVKFSYNEKQLRLTAPVKIKPGTATVQEVLQLLQSADMQYRILGNHVILWSVRVPATITVAKANTALPPAGNARTGLPHIKTGMPRNQLSAQNAYTDLPEKPGNKPIPSARQLSGISPATILHQATVKAEKDTPFRLVPVYILPAPRISPLANLLDTPVNVLMESDNTISRFSQGGKEKTTAFYTAAGLATDEIWRIGPVVQAGLPWLYAVGAWGTNFKQHAWSYGLGTSLTLSDQWKLHLMVTTGPLEKIYPYITDTINYDITVKGHLHRGMITFEKRLNAKYSIRLGPVMNILKTSYSRDGMPIVPGGGVDTLGNTELYPLLTVPYTISNTYRSSAFSNTKTWIGLQVSIFYRLQL